LTSTNSDLRYRRRDSASPTAGLMMSTRWLLSTTMSFPQFSIGWSLPARLSWC